MASEYIKHLNNLKNRLESMPVQKKAVLGTGAVLVIVSMTFATAHHPAPKPQETVVSTPSDLIASDSDLTETAEALLATENEFPQETVAEPRVGWWQDPDSGNWYYYGEDGRMFRSEETPDGYYVGEDGAYIPPVTDPDSSFVWNRTAGKPGDLSGLEIAGKPAEFYMLSMAGETSGGSIIIGDYGRAYGFLQFDYRYDLPAFMNYAYRKHPELWGGFADYLGKSTGSSVLINNRDIADTFVNALSENYEEAVSDQMAFARLRYWDDFADAMNKAGYHLDTRHVAVSAALLSVNINCGSQANVFLRGLSPDMSDEEMIRGIYRIRNTTLASQYVGSVLKGTTTRYVRSEPQMALDLLYGYTTIDSDMNYGGGVEWHGNPFSDTVSTKARIGSIRYQADASIAAVQQDAEQIAERDAANFDLATASDLTKLEASVSASTDSAASASGDVSGTAAASGDAVSDRSSEDASSQESSAASEPMATTAAPNTYIYSGSLAATAGALTEQGTDTANAAAAESTQGAETESAEAVKEG